jgi:L-alanine-DL-glutamate epimerase-like enolase superfamily enzyme
MCTETLRRDLAIDGFEFRDGLIAKPTRPGLGAELNMEALQKYRVA